MGDKELFVTSKELGGQTITAYLRSIGEIGDHDSLVLRRGRSGRESGVWVSVTTRDADPPKQSVLQAGNPIRYGTPSREMNTWWERSASKRKKKSQGRRPVGFLGQR